MFYLVSQILFNLLVAAALGALAGWLAKGVLAQRRDEVWRRELRRSEAGAGKLKNQLAEAHLVEDRLREELRGLEGIETSPESPGDAAVIQQLQAEITRRDKRIDVLKLQVGQSEAAVASEWQSLKAVKSEITERQERLEERGKQASSKLRDSEGKQQELHLRMRSMKRQSERLQEELKASQRALADERRKSSARRAKLEARLAKLEAKRRAAGVESAADDDLSRIRGIGPVLHRKLKEAGVTSFHQIASWSDGDLGEVASKIGVAAGRIRSGGWVEAARQLL